MKKKSDNHLQIALAWSVTGIDPLSFQEFLSSGFPIQCGAVRSCLEFPNHPIDYHLVSIHILMIIYDIFQSAGRPNLAFDQTVLLLCGYPFMKRIWELQETAFF